MARWHRRLGVLMLGLVLWGTGGMDARLGVRSAPVAEASHQFADVPDSTFFHDFVDFLVDSGITAGCRVTPPLYCGGDPVTRGQMAVFLKKLSDLVDQRVAATVAALSACPPDSVEVGRICLDKYEASMWQVPPGSVALIQKIKAGTVTLAELQAGAVQLGVVNDNYDGAGCPDTGNGCVGLYAASVAGAPPSRFLTWFQAQAAARNAGKRLPTNAEWQAAALGTPDPGDAPGAQDCNTNSAGPSLTGARVNCMSDVGAFDMVGNLDEWVADWVPPATSCTETLFGTGDANCMTIDPESAFNPLGPGALLRGGVFELGASGGVFSVVSGLPSSVDNGIGFRAAR